MGKRTDSTGLGSLATGAVTALALAVQTGLAAVVGVIIARELGRTAETDGFFAAYGVFIVLSLAASAIRIVVLPSLARARDDQRLGAETAAWALAFGVFALPVLVVCAAAARPIAVLLTGFGPDAARDAATDTLPLLVFAAIAQVFAGLAASALAALDDYVVAAFGYIGGSVLGLAVILIRVDDDGVHAVALGMALNGLVAVGVPVAALALRARRERMPKSAVKPRNATLKRRASLAGRGIALPLALQAAYLVCLPFAAREGVGAVTSFGYAYLAGAAVVAVTASSLGLVTSVPLTRAGLDTRDVANHVVSSSWLALLAVAATAGVFALAGEQLLSAVLGDSYMNRVGEELGRLVAAFSPWMVAMIGFSVALPVVFVAERTERLGRFAALVLGISVPLAALGQVIGGLSGLALALAVTTVIALGGILHALSAARETLRGLGRAAGLVLVFASVAFVPAGLLLPPLAAALAGLAVFAVLVAVARPRGLHASWRYLRALG